MTGVSGQFGQAQISSSDVAECTKWNFTRRAAIHKYASCATGGYKKAVTGTKDGSGTVEGIYDPNDSVDDAFIEGDSITWALYTTASKFYSVPAVVGEISFDVDLEEGDVVRWTSSFETNGAWSLPS